MIPVVAVTTHNFLLWLGSFIGFVVVVLFFTVLKFKGSSVTDRIGAALDQRAARIDAQLRMAEENQAAAKKAREESEAEIAGARAEAADIVGRAQQIKESLREELLASAEQDQARIVNLAREEIETERNRAILDLRSRAADVAVDAAREVLQRTVDERTDRDIIARALSDAGAGSGGRQ